MNKRRGETEEGKGEVERKGVMTANSKRAERKRGSVAEVSGRAHGEG